MGGRQAHGRAPAARSLGSRARKQKGKRENATATTKAGGHLAKALDAYRIAAKLHAETKKKTARDRIIDVDDAPKGRKHTRDELAGDEEDLRIGKVRKKSRGSQPVEDHESDVEYGSDDEGNKWRLGGPVDDAEDSEIESDDAFGESDEEKFKDFTFGGSKSKGKDESESEPESLGEDAIDLATALDRAMEESSESGDGSGSEEDDVSEDDSDTDPDEGGSGLEKLMTQYSARETEPGSRKSKKPDFAIIDEVDEPAAERTKAKISLSDLGLSDLKDLNMRKSVKLMAKEEKESRPGETKKVLKPLPKLHQDRIDRQAAFDTTVKTLSRWTETIKSNRRADNLVFPLPQERLNAGLSNTEFQPINSKTATSELEKTMLELLGPNGLDREPKKKKKEEKDPTAAMGLGTRAEEIRKRQEELVNQRRRERELQSREAKKHARLKKIKSKAFHRVHRKQKLKDMQDDEEEIDSEAEREEHDRRRALERVGARHKNSAWGKKAQRAVWDDEYRTGLTEAARKEHELRKRVEGRKGSGSEDESSEESASDSEGERDRLMRKVGELEGEDTTSKNQLMNMKFMRDGEERLRQENDRLIDDIRKTLGDDEEEAVSDEEQQVFGRRKYGPAISGPKANGVPAKKQQTANDQSKAMVPDDTRDCDVDVDIYTGEKDGVLDQNAWSKGKARKGGSGVTDLHVINNEDSEAEPGDVPVPKPRKESMSKSAESNQHVNLKIDLPTFVSSSKSKKKLTFTDDMDDEDMASDSDDSSGEGTDLLDATDKLILEAFGGGDEVVAEFEKEKGELAEEQDDKVIDNTLPGWGSWVGDGVSEREKKRHTGRFLQKVEGVKKKDRLDAKLERVIINEQRAKKNERFLASTLPHPFESKEQYERSLRLPVGKEWVTRETFHDGTKPRVIVKPGIIAPISRPTA